MIDLNTVVSISALIISLFALIHTYTKSVSATKLEAAQLRSDLLTRIVKLKLEYEQTISSCHRVLDMDGDINIKEVSDILNLIENYKRYIETTQGHYNGILEEKVYTAKYIVDIGHHIDALRVMVESETKQVRKKIIKLEASSNRKA